MSSTAGPVAAYLYTLSLDGSGLAWEYLRRNADYPADWLRYSRARSPATRARASRRAEPWGLRFPGKSHARRALGGPRLAA